MTKETDLIKMEDYLCRLCADTESSITYFNLEIEEEILDDIQTKLEKLNVVCNISKHPTYTNVVCLDCYNALNTACEFVDKVTTAQSGISELLSSSKNVSSSSHASPRSEIDIKEEFKLEIEQEEIKIPIKMEKVETSWSNYPWVCSDCRTKFNDAAELRKHSIQEHGLCCALICDDCLETFDSYKEFTDHVRNHQTHLWNCCIYCDEITTNIQECMIHERNHEETLNICFKCGHTFHDDDPISVLFQHKTDEIKLVKVAKKIVRSSSNDSLPSLISEEDKTCAYPVPPKEIPINTWDDYPWICRICVLAFNTVDLLRLHVKQTHNKCVALKCLDCKFNFRSASFDAFLKHVANHRRSLCKVCLFCRKEFPTINELYKHLREDHYKVTLYCKKCGVTFKSEEEQQEHLPYMLPKKIVREKKPYDIKDRTCKYCNKVYSSIWIMKAHMEKVHLKICNFTCEQCGSSFYSRPQLKEHILCVHSEKQFKCKICGKRFTRKSDLKKHIGSHSTDRPFPCKECGKRFKMKRLLDRHISIHSEIKPYKCQQCGKGFRRRENLKAHEIIHTGMKPYSCKICNVAYANKENCYNHMKKKHDLFGAKINLEVEFDEDAKKWKKRVFEKKRVRQVKDDLSD